MLGKFAKTVLIGLGGIGLGAGGWISEGHATTTGQFLEMLLDARSLGQGSAYLAVAGDTASINHNPAGLSLLAYPEVRASYRRDVLDINFGSLTGGLILGPGQVAGLGIYGLHGGSLTVEDTQQTLIAEEDLLASAAFAWDLQNVIAGWKYPLAAGVAVKYLYTTLAETYKSMTVAADFGVYAVLPWENFSVGLIAKNLGLPLQYQDTKEDLPLTFGGGASWQGTLAPSIRLRISADAVQTQGTGMLPQIGTELSYRQMVYLRGGYHFMHDTDSFSAGLGVTAYNLSLDYAFLKNLLADKHIITLGYVLAPPAPASKAENKELGYLAAKGITLFKQGLLSEAKAAWSAVLSQDQEHYAAKEYLRAYQKIKLDWLKQENQKAQIWVQQGQYSKAVQIWNHILKVEPGEVKATEGLNQLKELANSHVQAARQQTQLQAWLPALEEIDQALNILSDFSPALKLQEDVYAKLQKQTSAWIQKTVQQSLQLARTGEAERAFAMVRHALSKNPQNPKLLQTLEQLSPLIDKVAQDLKSKGRYRAAADLELRLTKLAPDYPAAKIAYREIMKEYQQKVLALFAQAQSAYRFTNYAESVKIAEKVYQISPEQEVADFLVRAYEAQGVADYREDRLVQAIANWEKGLTLNPTSKNLKKNIERAKKKVKFYQELGWEPKP